ncbi:M20 family metallo-hydrolase [Succinispira mobilis]|uniref:M20 family metallo-hydrolase n=1 Tax=Succinispira mobilis TaxID=78120 RepID=UPI0003710C44|nr:M20 family metallo-hydrolase [Succinispira mobilis]
MKIKQARVLEILEHLKSFGGSVDKGITRLAYSAEDLAAQKYIMEKMQELGMEVRRDYVGNIFARLPGKNPTLPTIASGSHLDTVKQGGAYDGALGVVAALEAAYAIKEQGLEHSYEVIIFMAEESTRFGFATIGSKLLAGVGTPETFSSATKKDELSYIEVLKQAGFEPEKYEQVKLDASKYAAFVELHIEQGRVLADSGEAIGVVENIAAPTRMKITVEGVADHSGATPMNFRKDALVSGAKLILAIEEVGKAHSEQGIVTTVGVVDIEPSSINVIPGKVVLWLDLRGVDYEVILEAIEEIHEAVRCVGEADEVKITIDVLTSDRPVRLSKNLADITAGVCQQKNIKYRRMNSGAGHDAMHMAAIMPTTMIFVPSIEGISHNPAEMTSEADIIAGVEVLVETILTMDKEI